MLLSTADHSVVVFLNERGGAVGHKKNDQWPNGPPKPNGQAKRKYYSYEIIAALLPPEAESSEDARTSNANLPDEAWIKDLHHGLTSGKITFDLAEFKSKPITTKLTQEQLEDLRSNLVIIDTEAGLAEGFLIPEIEKQKNAVFEMLPPEESNVIDIRERIIERDAEARGDTKTETPVFKFLQLRPLQAPKGLFINELDPEFQAIYEQRLSIRSVEEDLTSLNIVLEEVKILGTPHMRLLMTTYEMKAYLRQFPFNSKDYMNEHSNFMRIKEMILAMLQTVDPEEINNLLSLRGRPIHSLDVVYNAFVETYRMLRKHLEFATLKLINMVQKMNLEADIEKENT